MVEVRVICSFNGKEIAVEQWPEEDAAKLKDHDINGVPIAWCSCQDPDFHDRMGDCKGLR